MRFAIITPSYPPDFERCKLLCESIESMVSQPSAHYIVVDDPSDYRLFSQLQNSYTQVLQKSDLFPWWIHRLPGVRKFWFSWRTRPIRGWIYQQLAKIATAAQMSEDVAVFLDSDTTLVRPLELHDYFLRDGKLRLYSEPRGNPASMPRHTQWHDTASRLLGLEPTPMPAPDYIHNAVTWLRSNVQGMCERIEETSGKGWMQTLASRWQFSEYILYGTYVERVLGEQSGHFFDPQKICLDYWTPKPLSDQELREFVDRVEPQHIAVMLSAKAGMSPQRYGQLLSMISQRQER